MKFEDFSECEFINDYLRFVSYNDFCKNCNVIRAYYRTLSKNGKQFYKWFVYANILMNEGQKNMIWNFLNSETKDDIIDLLNLK